MTASVETNDPDVITKAEFARRREVSAGRVSQWISEGKIAGNALVGEGRAAKIRESVAVAQLRQKLDPMQMTANGLSTKLDAPALPQLPLEATAASVAPPPATDVPPRDSIEERIKQQRLEQIERANRNDRREEAQRAGRLVEAALVSQATGREITKLVASFEGKLSDFATAIAGQFKLSQRDVLHLLRAEFRKFRAGAAASAAAEADAMPTLVEIDLDAEDVESTEDELA